MRAALATLAAASLMGAGAFLGTRGPAAAQNPPPAAADTVPRAKLVRVARLYHREQRQARGLRRTLRHHPDFDVSLQLAGVAYGQDWRALKRCALSEGAREAERYQRHNRRPSRDGFGSVGGFQFLLGTFLSTPQGKAGMDRGRQDVQAHAAAWMWAQGRRGEWYGAGC